MGFVLFEFPAEDRDFSTEDVGEVLHLKILRLIGSSPSFAEAGGENQERLTYRDAFNIVAEQNPELMKHYMKTIRT